MTEVMVATALTVTLAELFIIVSFNYVFNSAYCIEQRFPNLLGSRRPKYLSNFFTATLGQNIY